MKKFIEMIPFTLLLVLTPYLFFNQPNIAQSLIIIAISALSGFRYFQINLEKPDYVVLFNKELELIRREQKAVREDYGRMSLGQMKNTSNPNTIRF